MTRGDLEGVQLRSELTEVDTAVLEQARGGTKGQKILWTKVWDGERGEKETG